jgi:hypothetical protein
MYKHYRLKINSNIDITVFFQNFINTKDEINIIKKNLQHLLEEKKIYDEYIIKYDNILNKFNEFDEFNEFNEFNRMNEFNEFNKNYDKLYHEREELYEFISKYERMINFNIYKSLEFNLPIFKFIDKIEIDKIEIDKIEINKIEINKIEIDN